MKVAIDVSVLDTNQAGTSTYVAGLLQGMNSLDLGIDIVLLRSGCRRPMARRKTLRSRLQTVYQDVGWTHLALPARAAAARVDLLHMPANVAPILASPPFVVFVHDTVALRMPEFLSGWHRHYLRLLLPPSVKRASLVLTNSECSKSEIVQYLHVEPDKVVVTYLAASPSFSPASPAEVQEVKGLYGLGEYVLAVGSLEPRKNLHRLVQAFARLHQQGYRVQLAHAGPPGWGCADLQGEADRLGVGEWLRVLGYAPRDQLRALYSGAALFAYPSLYEGFGLPILEAMACGCPVVTSSCASMPEVAGNAALFVDPLDVQGLADAMATILSDQPMAQHMIERGLERAACFSWERCAAQTAAAYRMALG